MPLWLHGAPTSVVPHALGFVHVRDLLLESPERPFIPASATEQFEDADAFVRGLATRSRLMSFIEGEQMAREVLSMHGAVARQVPFLIISGDGTLWRQITHIMPQRPLYLGLPTKGWTPSHAREATGAAWIDEDVWRHQAAFYLLREPNPMRDERFLVRFDQLHPGYNLWRRALNAATRWLWDRRDAYQSMSGLVITLMRCWQHAGIPLDEPEAQLLSSYLRAERVVIDSSDGWIVNRAHRLFDRLRAEAA